LSHFGNNGLEATRRKCLFAGVSTLTEIETALEELTSDELQRVEAALHRLLPQHSIHSPDIATLEDGNGFVVLPLRVGAAATPEDVRRLCAEEGI